MTRLALTTPTHTPAGSLPLLDAVQKQLGVVPNMMKLLANSPAALNGYLSLSGALSKGSLGAATGERIALAIAEINGCDYCLAAHTYLGKQVAHLSDDEVLANRRAASSDAKAEAALKFAAEVATTRGHASEAALEAVKAAGFNEAQVLEIVLHVALNTLTNYVNEVAQTPIDFPVVAPLAQH